MPPARVGPPRSTGGYGPGTRATWLDEGGSGYCSLMLRSQSPPTVATLRSDAVVALAAADLLARAADAAILVIGVAIVALTMILGRLLLQLTRAVRELRAGVHQNLGPVSDRARAISDNVEFVTQALRTDVEHLSGSVRALTDRLHQASDRMEERIEEFNALMEVVQDEAEAVFLDTASTVRGVRAGAREGARRIGRHPRATGDEESGLEGADADRVLARPGTAKAAESEGTASTG